MKNYLGTGITLIGANTVIGGIPNISGTTAEAGIKSNFSTGLSKAGTALPIMGKVAGGKMVLKSVGTIPKAVKKFKFGGYEL